MNRTIPPAHRRADDFRDPDADEIKVARAGVDDLKQLHARASAWADTDEGRETIEAYRAELRKIKLPDNPFEGEP